MSILDIRPTNEYWNMKKRIRKQGQKEKLPKGFVVWQKVEVGYPIEAYALIASNTKDVAIFQFEQGNKMPVSVYKYKIIKSPHSTHNEVKVGE